MRVKITLQQFSSTFKYLLALLIVAVSTTSISAQTTVGTGFTPNNGNALVTFNVKNNNTYAINITDIASYTFTPGSGAVARLFYKTSAINGAPGAISAANGWTLGATGAPFNGLSTFGGTSVLQPFITGMAVQIPAGATYGLALDAVDASSAGNLQYFNLSQPLYTFSGGGVDLTTGSTIGYGGGTAPAAPTFNPRGFSGSITFSPCIPTIATTPIGVSTPMTVCSGSTATLSVVSGALNGAANWKWYTGSCGGTLVGTGASITVNPAATTTYYVRGEGGCASGPGLCGQVTVNVTSCTCITPGAATICSGQLQLLSVTAPSPLPVQTVTSAPLALTIPSSGTSTPYPATLTVSGVGFAKVKSVTINGISHTWPSDVDIVLVSPSGVPVILMSDVGGSSSISGVNIKFQDGSPALPTSLITSGTYAPTNSGTPDNFPAPGPGSLTQATPTLASFGTTNVNGTWSLYVVDDLGGDQGSISGTMSIEFEQLPTATWSGGPLFTNAAGTIPYVAGTQAFSVYAAPTTTTTYTANISSGPCAGNNSVVVTVLPRPTVSVTPTSGCAPLTLTASGADAYNWSPTSGLSAASGATVTANPAATTTYSVTGVSNNGCTSATAATATVNAAATAATISTVPSFTYQIQEGFEGATLPTSWTNTNMSNPVGPQNWFPGGPSGVFPAQSGAGFAAANWANTTTSGSGTISSWLISPVVNMKNGDKISFWTRTTSGLFPDRLQLRLSTAGASTNVGANETTVGDFTALLTDINPSLTSTGYPTAWTRYEVAISGLSAPTSGRFAFRYFVTDGGGAGANSDFIGVDSVNYYTPVLFNCPNTVSNIAINITGGVGPFTVVYSNGTTNTTINGYSSGSPIQVSPATTTTYTIVSVTGANGCVATGVSTTGATVTVTQPGSIATQPANATIQCGGNATFTVAGSANSGVVSYQWQVSTDAGATWANVTNGGVYSGATTNTLTLTNLPITPYNGYQYRVVLNFACTTPAIVTSNAATLTVNPLVAVVTPNPVTICQGQIQKLTISNINSPAPASSSYSSGAVNIAVPDNNTAGISNAITVPPIVGVGNLLGAKVTVNMTHTWIGDVIIALKGPGGKWINVDWNLSGGGFQGTTGFVNTVFSSDVSLPLVGTGTAPYTGTYRFDAANTTLSPYPAPTTIGGTPAAGATALARVSDFLAGNTAVGQWTLYVYDAYSGDVGTLQNWSLELTYMQGAPSTGVWGPATALGTIFTDASGTTPYVANTPLNAVYVKPNATTTYTVVVTTPTPCTSSTTSIPVTVHTALTGSAAVANKVVCVGKDTKFFMSTTPGGMAAGVYYQWQVLTSATGTWANVANSGVYSGATTDTLRITAATTSMNGYQYRVIVSNACNTAGITSAAGTLTVDNPSAVISSTGTSVFPGQTVTLTASTTSGTGSSYQWYYAGVPISGATASTYVVDVDHAGDYTVVVTNSNGCVTSLSSSFTVGYTESTNLWIYPSPNTGVFQVRYYNQSTNTPRFVNIYDNKGSRVWVSKYTIGIGYTRMDVDLRKFGKGTYTVELTDRNGDRIKVGRVLVL